MTQEIKKNTLDRRAFLTTGTIAGASLGLAATPASAVGQSERVFQPQGQATTGLIPLEVDASDFGVVANTADDQTTKLEAALKSASAAGTGVHIGPGTFIINELNLPTGARLTGSGPSTVLLGSIKAPLMKATAGNHIHVSNMTLDGSGTSQNLIRLRSCIDFQIEALVVRNAREDNIHLSDCSGAVSHSDISNAGAAGLHAIQSQGLLITCNNVHECGNNGIQIWRRTTGHDGGLVTNNRITNIRAKAGGTGQNGNGVNVFRADNVQVNNNHISDCAFSAIRANAASNIQMVSNHCQHIGEVALYAEFGFEGALIANNVIDTAATGISVTNFNEGGRLGIVQGNLIRNLFVREHDVQDKRGNGIAVEADTTVTGNTIEDAPMAGIVIGWGWHMRDVAATCNLIRKARYGILVSSSRSAGACFIANNMMSGTPGGAIREHELGRAHGPELAGNDRRQDRIAIVGNVGA